MIRIVHVIERFASTGAERALIASAKWAARAGLPYQHTVCTLEEAASPLALALARQAGMVVLRKPDAGTLRTCLAEADIVQLHYWNNPSLQAFLRSDLPPMRLLIFVHIFGASAPQVVTSTLLDLAATVIFTSPGSLELPVVRQRRAAQTPGSLDWILAPADFDRLQGYAPQPHDGFNIGYIGVVNYSKLHPAFIRMGADLCRRGHIPEPRFIVCGTGGEQQLAAQAQAEGVADRYQFRGFVEGVSAAFAQFDLFGYPLRPDTYATSELVLQEAMWVGMPIVVFPHGGIGYLIEHEVTGLAVHSEQAYVQAIEKLYHDPAERQRLGANARAHAHTQFDPMIAVRRFAAHYDSLMQQPKQVRSWPAAGGRPAEWFVASLGDQAGPFAANLAETQEGLRCRSTDTASHTAAEAEIAAASDLLFSGEGGIAHYRNSFPDDPQLRWWVGLVLQHRGRHERAQTEFAAAAALASA